MQANHSLEAMLRQACPEPCRRAQYDFGMQREMRDKMYDWEKEWAGGGACP
jgi:hypothetical protein